MLSFDIFFSCTHGSPAHAHHRSGIYLAIQHASSCPHYHNERISVIETIMHRVVFRHSSLALYRIGTTLA